MACEEGWQTKLLQRSAKVKSTFRGPSDTFGANSADVPSRFQDKDAAGRSFFIAWANLPLITYSADPATLYDMSKLGEDLRNSECFVSEAIGNQKTTLKYPKEFYLGVFVGGVAVLYTLFKGRKS